MGEDRLGRGEDRGAVRRQLVERAAAGQAFDLAPVEQARVDPLGEVVEAGEGAAALALGDQRLHRFLADALQRAERVADRAVLDREVGAAGVDRRRQALDAAAAHVLDEQVPSLSVCAMSKLIDAA